MFCYAGDQVAPGYGPERRFVSVTLRTQRAQRGLILHRPQRNLRSRRIRTGSSQRPEELEQARIRRGTDVYTPIPGLNPRS